LVEEAHRGYIVSTHALRRARGERTVAKGSDALFKPGERAPQAGTYECYLCRRRGERSVCEMGAGQLFLACPKCLERKVPEWDLVWMPAGSGSTAKRRTFPWPGSLARPA
jgi:hypothetical protein